MYVCVCVCVCVYVCVDDSATDHNMLWKRPCTFHAFFRHL
uniref:Bm647, isoform a n=1 Tax=Brugia malayi TaxID=6279 RepID=A0A1I9G4I9_BRUMA|nr:Bm647, isoform a [Brugia malayi]